MKQLFFTKLSGAGNDFVLLDSQINGEIDLKPQKIKEICDRHNGIGADGLIFFNEKPGVAFEMKNFNADGTTGSLCANGARCTIFYASHKGLINGSPVSFLSNGTSYSGQDLGGGKVKFNLNAPSNFKFNFKVKAAGQLINASFVDTGSPHVVIDINEILLNPKNPGSVYRSIDEVPVYEIGKEIRYSKDFAPGGTNVNFYEVDKNVIKVRTYERGVENETLACGTGIVATALILNANKKVNPPMDILTKGGDLLTVDFKIVDQKVETLSLVGPAKIIFKGEITI
ncbi:MAG: diaminopimelate epimerase [Bacteroidota bacterium]